MFSDLSILPTSWFGWFGVLSLIVTGVLTLYNRARNDNMDNQKKLIDTLKERVDILSDSQTEMVKQLAGLTGENRLLKELLLQTDPESKMYRQMSIDAVKQTNEIYAHLILGKKGRKIKTYEDQSAS